MLAGTTSQTMSRLSNKSLSVLLIQRRRMPVELHNPKVEGSSPSATRKIGVAQR